MNPAKRREMQNLNSAIRSKAWINFRAVLDLLCLEHKDNPIFQRCSGLLRNNDVKGLVLFADSLSVQKYTDATEHFVANQLSLLIRKYPFPKDLNPFDPEGVAISKFWKAEHRCARVNQRFRAFLKRSPYEDQLARMRNFIAYNIGYEVPLSTIWDNCDFGPGANMGVHGNATNLAAKLASHWSVTPSALLYGRAAMKTHAQLFEYVCSDDFGMKFFYSHDPDLFNQGYDKRCHVVAYNKIAFVPKTVTTHRSIAVEPLVNSYLQKGVDVVLRRNLLRAGIDLSDQGVNIELARLGSLDPDSNDSFVTLDLSSASDSISIELVRALLPPDWFEFLNSIRSRQFMLGGKIFTYNKFCSMGNGFCFPLETLLFVAACSSVGAGYPGRDFHVYGDDIIIKKRYASKLVDLLKVMGFSLNMEKSFIEGPFRESCGRDWFLGEDVRPFTFDFALDSIQSIFKFLNLTQRNTRCSSYFEGVRPLVMGLIPRRWQFLRPCKGNEDTAIDVELDEFMAGQHSRFVRNLQCWSWLELQTSPIEYIDWKKLVRRDLILVFGVLRGADSQRPFTYRRKTSTRVRRVAHSGGHSTWLPGAVKV